MVDLSLGLKELQAFYAIDGDTKDPVAHAALLEGALASAKEKGVVAPLFEGAPVTTADPSRLRTIRDRLINLGYLDDNTKEMVADKAFAKAVAQFQQEAGITEDGWVGNQTWTALQELVSFETPSNMARWFDGDTPRKALEKATHWRLYALGLSPSTPRNGQSEHLSQALRQFVEAVGILGIAPPGLEARLSIETLSFLFDQDALVLAMAGIGHAPEHRNERLQVHAFVMNLAKVELWLLGFPVEPDGHDSKDKDPMRRSRSLEFNFSMKSTSSLYKAIEEYWQLHEAPARAATRANKFAQEAFPQFFRQLHADTSVQGQVDSQEVYNYFNHAGSRELDAAWKNVRSMGARLWDGLKRIWNWLVNLAKKVVRYVTNLVRIGYDLIHKSYSTVVASMQVIVRSVEFFVCKELHGSDPKHVIIRHDLDFDFKSLIDKGADSEKVRHVSAIVSHNASGFALACKIINFLTDVVKSAFNKLFTGYLMLLVGLVNLYKEISDLVPSLEAWVAREKQLAQADLS